MKHLFLVASLLTGAAAALHGREPIRLANNPALSPDGAMLAFDWFGDIWTVPTTGGVARQLTAHPAKDSQPKFSPDGRRIAFISDREGSPQVYVMSASGGAPRQVTFHTAGFSLHGWTPDGNRLLVGSQRDHFWRNAERFFLVNAETRSGEEMLFDDYGANGQLSPDGTKILFTREGPAWWRKGYRGSQASQIWMYDLASKSFQKQLYDESGSLWPLWKPDAAGFYFVAGKGGAYDLWEKSFASKEGKQLTKFTDDESVVFPCISRDGSTIVFRRLFDLYRYKPGETAPPQKIDIVADVDRPGDRVERRVLTTASAAAFTGDGLEIAIIAGGDLWVMDTELREPKRILATAEEERSPVFSPEAESILFISDRGGKSDIYRVKRSDATKFWWQNSEFQVERLTTDGEQKNGLDWSPNGTHVAFTRGRGELCIMTPDGKNIRTIVKGFSRPEYDWSPDGKWLVISVEDDDFNRDIHIIAVDGSKPPFNVSRHPRNDGNPTWSPDGKLIAFIGQRGEERDIFYVWLRAEDAETGSRDRTLEKAIEKMNKGRKPAAGRGTTGGDGDSAAANPMGPRPVTTPKKTGPVVIDFDGLNDRVRRVATPGVGESNLFWSADSKKLVFTSMTEGRPTTMYLEPGDAPTPKPFNAQVLSDPRWLAKANQVVGLSSGVPTAWSIDPLSGRPRASVGGAEPSPAAPAAVPPGRVRGGAAAAAPATAGADGSYRFNALQDVDVPARNAAVFDLAWRTMRDNYYDDRLGNRDWNKVKEKYLPAATEAPDSDTLGVVVNLMLGELNGSHLGFYPGISNIAQRRSEPSNDAPIGSWRATTAHLGVRFDPAHQGPGLKIRDVIPGTPADQRKSRLLAGEIIIQIDGKPVDATMDLTTVLNGPPSRDIVLTVNGIDGKVRSIIIRPTTWRDARQQLYTKWIKDNQTAVDKLSANTLGYLHIAAMDATSFQKFEEQLYAAGAGKDGLIIDVRENGGGSTADHLLTALTQPVHAVAVPRGGKPGYPHDRKIYATWNKPITVLCNQNSFSNAEIFSHAVKTLKRGQVVGVPTAGGVISTGATTIMDAGLLRLPFRGWYLVGDGQDMELNGAVPHHVLWPQPGEMPTGKDMQLAKAVEVLKDDVAKWKAAPRPKLTKAMER